MRKKYFFKFYKNFIDKICDFIIVEKSIKNINKTHKKTVFAHFIKSQEIIKLYFFFLIAIINTISFLIYFKKFKLIKNNCIKKIFSILSKIELLKSEKILELAHALIIISSINNEKIIKKKNINFNKRKNHFRNIVIGSGPSGSVTALELKKKNKEVLLIEKGYEYTIPKSKHSGDEFLKKWENSGLASSIGNINLQYSSGSCFGGGSEINSGLFHKLDQNFFKKIYDNNQDVAKLAEINQFIKLTDNYNTEINYNTELTKLKNLYHSSSQKLKWKLENLKRFYSNKNGNYEKKSMTNSLLKDYVKLGGDILLGYELVKIKKYSKKKCKLFLKNKNFYKIITCENLFLCCGAPYSLKLLHKNNLINKNHNNNFHFHPMIKVIGKFKDKVNSINGIEIINSQITEFYPKHIIGNAASNLQFLKISTYKDQNAYEDVSKNFDYMSIFHCTFSLGTSKFLYFPFLKDPLIKYKFSKTEIQDFKEGIKNLINFVFKCDAEYVYLLGNKIKKINDVNSFKLDKIKEKDLNLSSVHLLGGLKMGKNSDCPLEIGGKLKNDNFNIFINDSSLICEKILKNPQNAIMAIAKTNIEILLKNERSF
jgi:hypothetical protein